MSAPTRSVTVRLKERTCWTPSISLTLVRYSRRCQPNGRWPEPTKQGSTSAGSPSAALFFAVVAVLAIAALAALPGIDEVRDRVLERRPGWIVAAAGFRLLSMLGFVRALWSAFDRVMPWRRALVLGLAEQGANVLLPAGGAGGPAFGAYVLTRLGVPADLARQPPRGALPDHERGELRRDHPRGRADRGRHPARRRVADRRRCCPRSAPRS